MKTIRFIFSMGIALALFFAFSSQAQARLVPIAWEDAHDPNIRGFRIYVGSDLGTMQQVDDVLVAGLSKNAAGDWTYSVQVSDTAIAYLALTAYAADGFESDFSNHKLYNDDDGDGVANAVDAFPNDPMEWVDTDGDGVGDNADAYPNDPTQWVVSASPEPSPTPTPPPPTSGTSSDHYRINVGGQTTYVDPSGNQWLSDNSYVNTGFPVTRSVAIAGTNMPTLYQVGRWDDASGEEMRFSFPVPAGTYGVRLHFAETWSGITAPGMRLFNVAIEGVRVLSNFDVFAQAGFATAHVEEFVVDVSDGSLTIELQHITQNPEIAGIEIFPSTDTAGSSPPPDPNVLTPPGKPTIIMQR